MSRSNPGKHLLRSHFVAKDFLDPTAIRPSQGCPRFRSCLAVLISILFVFDQKGFNEKVAKFRSLGDMLSPLASCQVLFFPVDIGVFDQFDVQPRDVRSAKLNWNFPIPSASPLK